jgi:two-component system chemotaxis response regulator CheY
MFAPETKILIADDMMTMRKIVVKTLKDLGYNDVQDAADGNLAWEKLKASNPPVQLIISDWNMPNCTGLDFLKKVRADAATSKVPFIMLTAETEKHQVMEALKAGVTHYCIKPFTPEVLKAKLEEAHKKISAAQ